MALLLALACSVRAAYPRSGGTEKRCVGLSCPMDSEDDGGKMDGEGDPQSDKEILAEARDNPIKYAPGSPNYFKFMSAVQRRIHEADFGKRPAPERKRELRDIVRTLQIVDPSGAKYIQTKNFGIISANTELDEPVPEPVKKELGLDQHHEAPVFGGGGTTAKTAPAQQTQQPTTTPQQPLPPGAPKDSQPGTILTQSPSGSWDVQPPAPAYADGGEEDGKEPGKTKVASKSVSAPTGGGGGASGLGGAAAAGLKGFAAAAERSAKAAAGAAGGGAAAKAMGTPSGRGAGGKGAREAGGAPGQQGGAPSRAENAAEAAPAIAAAGASLPESAKAAARLGPLPRALERQPDYFDPKRGGVAPERFHALKADYAAQPQLRGTDFKHITPSADGRDLERSHSCDLVSGECNTHAQQSYAKGDPVPPAELDSIWKSVRAHLNARAASAAAPAGAIDGDGIWGKLRGMLGGRRGRGAVAADGSRGSADVAEAGDLSAGGSGRATGGAAGAAGAAGSVPGAEGQRARGRRGAGTLALLGLSVGLLLVLVPWLRRER
jgi:hypothetical protein